MRTRLVIAALAIPVALLSACGDDDGDNASDPGSSSDTTSDSPSGDATDTPTEAGTEPTEEPTETEDPSADWPKCAGVWRDGGRLPRGYQGCREGGTGVKADSRGCSFGRPLITYADRFYGVPSGIIHETAGALAKDRGYRSALASCTA